MIIRSACQKNDFVQNTSRWIGETHTLVQLMKRGVEARMEGLRNSSIGESRALSAPTTTSGPLIMSQPFNVSGCTRTARRYCHTCDNLCWDGRTDTHIGASVILLAGQGKRVTGQSVPMAS